MRAGVHVSLRPGLLASIQTASRLGCETIQLFTRPLHRSLKDRFSDEEIAEFTAARKSAGLTPLVLHTPYLPNLCTTHPRIGERSRRALREDLEDCLRLEADYYVIHPGAYSPDSSAADGIASMAKAVNEGLSTGGRTRILLENMAGGSRRLGSTWEELRAFLDGIHAPERIGICLDTAHTLGAGHAFSTGEEALQTLEAFDREIGLDRLFLIHANGSRAERGSHRDWHDHLDQGSIQASAFQALFRHPGLTHAALILETPRDRPGADAHNLALVKAWR